MLNNDILCPWVQVRFDPSSLQYKTMKSMDKAARLAMMPDYEMYCVDLTQGITHVLAYKKCNET
jgi:hypothetical protein